MSGDNIMWIDLQKIELEKRRLCLDMQKVQIEVQKIQIEREKVVLETTKTAHARWWQEDSLVHNRLTWLLHSQTVLIATYGYFYSKKQEARVSPGSKIDLNINQRECGDANGGGSNVLSGVVQVSSVAGDRVGVGGENGTIGIIPWIGFLVCLFIFFGVHAARTAQRYLKHEYSGQNIMVGVSVETSFGGMCTSYLIPVAFMFGWGFVYGGGFWGLMFFLSGIYCAVLFEIWIIKHNIRWASEKAKARLWYACISQSVFLSFLLPCVLSYILINERS